MEELKWVYEFKEKNDIKFSIDKNEISFLR